MAKCRAPGLPRSKCMSPAVHCDIHLELDLYMHAYMSILYMSKCVKQMNKYHENMFKRSFDLVLMLSAKILSTASTVVTICFEILPLVQVHLYSLLILNRPILGTGSTFPAQMFNIKSLSLAQNAVQVGFHFLFHMNIYGK